ncbi:MAG: NAD-dependent epimerase/dehydratase family protein [Anaerolineae bacterium]
MGLQGQTVLVTGATGFVGGALASRLLADGVTVRAFVRSAERGKELAARGATLVVGDLSDREALAHAVAGCDVVFNVGAAMHGTAAQFYAVNVTGVRHLVEVAHEAGVRRIVHVSTIAVYGYDRYGVLSEEMPPHPGGEGYGQSKALGEQMLFARAAELGIEATAIRPGMIYGPGSGFWTAKLFGLMRRRPAPLPGSGQTYCPIVYIDDVIALLLTVAEHENAVGQVFNCVSDEPVTWRQFLGAYAAMAGHQMFVPVPLWLLQMGGAVAEVYLRLFGEPQPVRQMVRALLARRRGYSVNKAAQLLDWRPQVTLVQGMAQAETWLRETGLLQG